MSDPREIDLDPELRALWDGLTRLHERLRAHTRETYGRVNPFVEDLFDWKAKGAFLGGKDVTVYDSATVIGNVSIGDNTWVGPFTMLDGTGGLSIGSFCSIATGAQLYTHDSTAWAVSGGRLPYEYGPVTVEDSCFVGSLAVITRGVTVGTGSIVGAGAVVVADVPPRSAVAGVPARVVGSVEVRDDGIAIVPIRE